MSEVVYIILVSVVSGQRGFVAYRDIDIIVVQSVGLGVDKSKKGEGSDLRGTRLNWMCRVGTNSARARERGMALGSNPRTTPRRGPSGYDIENGAKLGRDGPRARALQHVAALLSPSNCTSGNGNMRCHLSCGRGKWGLARQATGKPRHRDCVARFCI